MSYQKIIAFVLLSSVSLQAVTFGHADVKGNINQITKSDESHLDGLEEIFDSEEHNIAGYVQEAGADGSLVNRINGERGVGQLIKYLNMILKRYRDGHISLIQYQRLTHLFIRHAGEQLRSSALFAEYMVDVGDGGHIVTAFDALPQPAVEPEAAPTAAPTPPPVAGAVPTATRHRRVGDAQSALQVNRRAVRQRAREAYARRNAGCWERNCPSAVTPEGASATLIAVGIVAIFIAWWNQVETGGSGQDTFDAVAKLMRQ